MTCDAHLGPIAHGGYCVARVDGRVVFVRGGLPGEDVSIEITDDSHASHWFAQVVSIRHPSPYRVTPPCPVAQLCGGCDFQHVELGQQRELKGAVLAEQLNRIAGIDWHGTVQPIPGSEDGLGWRTRMQYRSLDGVPALRGHRSHDLVAVPDDGCPLAHPAGRAAATVAAPHTQDLLLVTVSAASTDDPQVSVINDGELVLGATPVTESVGDRRWKVDASGFWQVHPHAAQTLGSVVLEELAPRPGETALDLYCGVGGFALSIAHEARARGAHMDVTGIEITNEAIESARGSAKRHGFAGAVGPLTTPEPSVRAHFDTADATEWARHQPNLPEAVVVNPPRRGIGDALAAVLNDSGVHTIAYSSCNPETLAADLARMPNYRIARVRLIDMFPHSAHNEALVLLTRVTAGES